MACDLIYASRPLPNRHSCNYSDPRLQGTTRWRAFSNHHSSNIIRYRPLFIQAVLQSTCQGTTRLRAFTGSAKLTKLRELTSN